MPDIRITLHHTPFKGLTARDQENIAKHVTLHFGQARFDEDGNFYGSFLHEGRPMLYGYLIEEFRNGYHEVLVVDATNDGPDRVRCSVKIEGLTGHPNRGTI